MYLQNIKLWNFRKFGTDGSFDINNPNLNLDFTKGLNILIGENDSGKTAIIDAIKLSLKTHASEWIKPEREDFFGSSEKFRIEFLFKNLSVEEAKHFTEWLSWEGDGENAEPILIVYFEATQINEKIITHDLKAGLPEDGYVLNSDAKEFLKVTYLKPLRDAKSELIPKKASRLSQIFEKHDAFREKDQNHILIDIFKNFNKSIALYFKGFENDGTTQLDDLLGKELKDEIDYYLKSFYDNSRETDIKVSEAKLRNILEKLELLVKDEINVGLGTLNRLFMSSELVHLNKKNWDGIRLGLVEELEAHLHPQAQMQIIESLQKYTDIQLILTTHSPNLSSKVKLENIIICTKNYAFPLGEKYTKLKKTDYPFLERFLDVTKSNLFFAKGLVLVEGVSEEIIIPALADKLFELNEIKSTLTSASVSVIPIGNTAFLRYSKIFLRSREPQIDIPISIVNDLDLRPIKYAEKYNIPQIKRKENNIISEYDLDNFINQKKSKLESQSIRAFISNSWTLEHCIASHPTLRKILFKSIVQCVEELRADNYKGNSDSKKGIRPISELNYETKWDDFIDNKNNEQIAFDLMYEYIIDNKKISKSMIAMYFAQFLKTDIVSKEEIIIENSQIQYLIDAIKYATRNV